MNDRNLGKARPEVWWFEPRWSYVPDVERAVAFINKKRFWLGCVLIPYTAFVVSVIMLGRWFSELEDETARMLLAGAVAILGLVIFLRFGFYFIPQIVAINKHGISRGGRWMIHDRILRLTLDARNLSQPVLAVELKPHHRGPPRFFLDRIISIDPPRTNLQIGISPRIQPAKIAGVIRELFPEIELKSI